MTPASPTCPSCGQPVPPDARFCEGCGAVLSAVVAVPASTPAGPAGNRDRARCTECGGEIGPDLYCEQCGLKAASPRDHYEQAPANWVAGVCDRGIRHHRNEDAMDLAADPEPGSRAVLVVCDGVSSSTDSDVASQAGVRAALGVLRRRLPRGLGTPQSRLAAVTQVYTEATAAANDAVVNSSTADTPSPASATFVAAVVEGAELTWASLGDSRAYWLPDTGDSRLLTVDDSGAQALIELGVDRAAAESSPGAHAITKWLGRDAPDTVPRVGAMTLDGAGWLLVCSDGLWNYASEPEAMTARVRLSESAATANPLELARELVAWANGEGGHDNITVALARITPAGDNADDRDDGSESEARHG